MKSIIIYVSFLLSGNTVSGSMQFAQDSVRIWDGSGYKTLATKHYGLNRYGNGYVSTELNGKLVVIESKPFYVNYFIDGKLYHFRKKKFE